MKLYVGNLAFSITQETLKKEFSEFGEVTDAVVIVDKFSNRSKGFGFVTFSDDEAAKKAIAGMNDKELEGRPLKVNEAKPMEERPRREFNGGNRGGSSGGRFGGGNRGGDRRDSRGGDRPKRY